MESVYMQIGRRLTPAVVILFTLAAGQARAQGTTAQLGDASLQELMNVTVRTASGTDQSLADAPARMQVVTEGQIRRRGYRSLAEVLNDIPEFKVDLNADPDYPTELTVQGTRGANRVIVLLDGIRISSPTNEPLPILANYPVHNAEQIEIVFGPASALYGADAFSAVINIISKDPAARPGLVVDSSVGQYGLYNQSATYSSRIGAAGSLFVAGQLLRDRQPDLSRFYPADFQGLRGQHSGVFDTIYGPMAAAGTVSPDYDIPLSAGSLQAGFRRGGLRLSLFENRSRVSTALPTRPDNSVYNAAAFNRNTLIVGAGSYVANLGSFATTSTVTASRHELAPESGYWNVYSNMQRSYKYAYGSMLKGEEQVAWMPNAAMTVTAGATLEHFNAIPQTADLSAPLASRARPGMILDTNIPDYLSKLRYDNTGVYSQLQYAMSPRLALTVGGRADYNTRYGGTFNPRVGFVAKPADHTTLKLLYGTAYLAPSPYQAYTHYGSFVTSDGGRTYTSEYWHVPNPDLKPQNKRTLEATVQQGMTAWFSLSASTFYSMLRNNIQFSDPRLAGPGFYLGWPVDYIDFPVNQGNETSYGGTVALDFMKPYTRDRRVDARVALTIANGHESRAGADGLLRQVQIGAMAPVQLRMSTDTRWGPWSLSPRLVLSGRQRLNAFAGDTFLRQTLPGYATVDASLRREHVLKNLDLYLTVENAFDARYRDINRSAGLNPEDFVGTPQNPRRITLGAQVNVF
jgi:outer membrane receptor protein involved in Fe transport